LTGPTGATGPSPTIQAGTAFFDFSGAGLETLSNSTSLSATTYPSIWIGQFQQTSSPPQQAAIAELYFANNSGTWWIVMTADVPGGQDYDVTYYYT
jgi:hypothetical protein